MLSVTKINPLCLFLYFASQIVCTMLFLNPIIILLSVLFSLTFCIMSSGIKGIWFYFLFFIIIAISNPIFSHNGATPLIFVNGNAITLEAIVYGVLMAGMILATFINLKNFNTYITEDKLIYIFGKYTPKLALLITMVLNFIPTLIYKGNEIYNCQKLIIGNSKKISIKIKLLLSVMSSLISQMLENGIITADSMSARGYTSSNRSNSIKYAFKKSDLIFIVLVTILFSITFTIGVLGYFDFYCYPVITSVSLDTISIIGYLSFFILSVTPIIIFLIGEIKWKYLISKI